VGRRSLPVRHAVLESWVGCVEIAGPWEVGCRIGGSSGGLKIMPLLAEKSQQIFR
jgi:hypothetical protein